MTRLITLLLVLAMPLVNSALAQCSGDVNGDGVVDSDDYDLCEGLPDCSVCDVNWDGVVDPNDLAIIVSEQAIPCVGFRPVPLRVWDPNCYTGSCDAACQDDKGCLPVGQHGVGFSDLNADGWPDAAVWTKIGTQQRRRVYRNNGLPLTWTAWCMDGIDPSGGYGVHWCDYNGDGYPEYAAARTVNPTKQDITFRLNPADPNNDVTNCLKELTVCVGLSGTNQDHETLVWADLDGDLDLDLFAPAYDTKPPDPNDLTGNRLLINLGVDPNDPNNCPTQPPTLYKFDPNGAHDPNIPNNERLTWYGPDPNDPDYGYLRPEGAQACDYDQDGDLDLVFSEHIWQNITSASNTGRFRRLDLSHTGIVMHGDFDGWPEEGCLFADFDMDGDFDLLRVTRFGGYWYVNLSRGDGTFVTSEVEGAGYGFGTSAADWDNDGDLDFTAGGRFWRNLTVEHRLTPASIPDIVEVVLLEEEDSTYLPIEHAMPSWADVDRDGDLDCARAAYGGGVANVKFHKNHLYSGDCGDCDEATRRYVNVCAVRVAPLNGPISKQRDYTENEYGARVEIVLRNDPDEYSAGLGRAQFTSSAAGYLNQNEYLLHFGLPPDPDPNDPNEDLRFEVYVDFPMRADEPDHGPWRVDWTVNPQLKDINLADLYVDCKDEATLGRPITVYREGRVRFKGADPNWEPNDPNIARLYTLGGPLRLPDPNLSPLPGLTSGNVLAGIRFEKEPNSPELRIREIIVDGQLDQTTSGCAYNVVLLDVTDPNSVFARGALKAKTSAHNHRTFIHVPPDPNDPNSFVLPANGASTTTKYEVRVRVTSYRENTLTDLTGLDLSGAGLGVTVDKNLRKANSSGANICTANMSLDSTVNTPVTIRLSRKGT